MWLHPDTYLQIHYSTENPIFVYSHESQAPIIIPLLHRVRMLIKCSKP